MLTLDRARRGGADALECERETLIEMTGARLPRTWSAGGGPHGTIPAHRRGWR